MSSLLISTTQLNRTAENMKRIVALLTVCTACAKQPMLPASSVHNVTSFLNDSIWFATGKAIRLVKTGEQSDRAKQFNLQIITDIDYPDTNQPTRLAATTGCTGDCITTQRLHLYNIPMKKGRFNLSWLDKRRTVALERTNYWLLVKTAGSGVRKNYKFEGRRPGWIRITRYDPASNTIEGRFTFSLDEDLTVHNRLVNSIPPVARFREGLFRVTLTNVVLKE